jgi:RND family efflux transporter MFP subunit
MTTTPPDLSQLRLKRDEAASADDRGSRLPWILGLLAAATVAGMLWFVLVPKGPVVRTAVAEVTGGAPAPGAGLSANGYVVAQTKASVSARIIGRMVYLGVHEGSVVRRGQTLARIEDGDYQAAVGAARASVARAEAELAQARRDAERAQSLYERQVISSTEMENQRTRVGILAAGLEEAQAQAALAQANLENTRVRAPFDGTVLRKDAEVGEIVAPSSAGGGFTRTAIVTMADLSTLEVEVDVNEAYIAQITGAQPARIILDAYPDTSFRGAVRQVVPTADRQKATVQVKVSILDRDPRILPEMGAKVVFEPGADSLAAAAPRRVLVPQDALARDGGATRVWVVEQGKVAARTVQAGRQRGENVEIVSGLGGGETVVVGPPAGLRDGVRVRVAGP